MRCIKISILKGLGKEGSSDEILIYEWSGREDSNLRLPAPKAGALAKLRHAPNILSTVSPVFN